MKQIQKILLPVFAILLLSSVELNAQTPVTYKISEVKEAKSGDTFSITVNFTTKGDWYIYAPTGANEAQGMIETKINFEAPEGIELVGELELPAPKPRGSYQVYDGTDIIMTQKFKVVKNAGKGEKELKVTVLFQTCNKEMCLPPQTTEHIQKLTIK